MIEKVYSNPDIYLIYVPLPNNPLKNLNCHVIKTPTENLIIDTGFNQPECYEALTEGLKELDVDINKSKLYLTHLHTDHIGLAPVIMNDDSQIFMGKTDHQYFLNESTNPVQWKETEERFCREGFPEEYIEGLRKSNPARGLSPSRAFSANEVVDGDKITVGEYEFTVISVPGHTPGNTCLYLESQGLMFLGDHVLFDITPNITCWRHMDNSLKQYLESLEKIKSYDMKTVFPAHRTTGGINVYDRIEALFAHHKARLQNTLDIVEAYPDSNAHDIAALMRWSMRGKDWSEFPIHQKWFAVGETIAHLDYLLAEGKISRQTKDGLNIYHKI